MTDPGTFPLVTALSTGSPDGGLVPNFAAARTARSAVARVASPRLFPTGAWSRRSGHSS